VCEESLLKFAELFERSLAGQPLIGVSQKIAHERSKGSSQGSLSTFVARETLSNSEIFRLKCYSPVILGLIDGRENADKSIQNRGGDDSNSRHLQMMVFLFLFLLRHHFSSIVIELPSSPTYTFDDLLTTNSSIEFRISRNLRYQFLF
jgi:hypothetical protein